MARTADVAIVGGGTIGLAIAWRAAQRGLDVVLADPEPGRGASWAAAGMLAPVSEVEYEEEHLLDLALASAAAWPDFAAELSAAADLDVGYRDCGTLFVGRDADDMAVLDALLDYQRRLGLDVERLGGSQTRELEPLLDPSVRGGLLTAEDHAVDNRRVVTALQAAAVGAGAELVHDVADRIVVDGGRARGIQVGDGGRIDAGSVVVAAGAHSRDLPGLPDAARPPVRPVKGELLYLRAMGDRLGGEPFIRHNVRAVVRGRHVYLVARGDGRYVLGATAEERGFDTTVTVNGVWSLLRDAREILPSITELELLETTAGLRPGSPDNAPVLGPTPVDGLVLATGHYRNGVLLTPVTATAIVDLLVEGHLPDVAKGFTLDRFAAGGRREHGGRP